MLSRLTLDALRRSLPMRITQCCLNHTKSGGGGSEVRKVAERYSRLFKTSTCGFIQEALANCTKACSHEECCAPGPRDAKCPRNAQHPAESYRNVMAKVTSDSLQMRNCVLQAREQLVRDMAQANDALFCDYKSKLDLKMRKICKKVDEILRSNVECGNQVRQECLFLCDKIDNQLQKVRCVNDSGVGRLRCRMDVIEKRVNERTLTAVEVVRTCRGCVTPFSMLVDLDMTHKEAQCILELTNKYIREQLVDVEKYCRELLAENKRALKETVAALDEDVVKFGKHVGFLRKQLPKKMRQLCRKKPKTSSKTVKGWSC